MTKARWKKIIEEQMKRKEIGAAEYTPVVETLAGILEQRDKVFAEYKKSKGEPVIEYTNKAGATNLVKNPRIILWDDLNKSALLYWKELGLTPSSYKKITGDKPQKEKKLSGLAEALAAIQS